MFQSQDYLNRAQNQSTQVDPLLTNELQCETGTSENWPRISLHWDISLLTSYFADVKSVHKIHPDCEWMEAGVLKRLGSEAAPLKTVITNSVSRQTWCFCCSPKRWPHLRMKRFCKHTKWEYSKYLKKQQLTSNHDAYRQRFAVVLNGHGLAAAHEISTDSTTVPV